MLKEYTEWQYWIDALNEDSELSQAEKRKARATFVHLEKQFGPDFLNIAFACQHPLTSYLINRAPWTRRWFIWFDELLQCATDYKNFDRVAKKLKNAHDFDEALLDLDFACRLGRSGFEVEFYPPTWHKKNREADLQLVSTNTKERFFVEIATLKESKQSKEIWETFNTISQRIFLKSTGETHIYSAGKIYKYLSPSHLQEIISSIDSSMERARKIGFSELCEPNVIELAFAHEDRKSDLETWAEERGLKDSKMVGPSINEDEVKRIASKIDKEQRQLPLDSLSVLIIESRSLIYNLRDPSSAIKALEEQIYRFGHLVICYILTHYMGGGKPDYLVQGQHFYIKRPRIDLMMEQGLILVNRFIKDKSITPKCLSDIIRGLMPS